MAHREGPFNRHPFDHRQHVKFAWSVLHEAPEAEAMEIVRSEISEFARLHAPGKYHETLTQFWVRLVAHTREHAVADDEFDEHLERFPILTNKNAQDHHFSTDVLWSHRARTSWVEPDLLPMP